MTQTDHRKCATCQNYVKGKCHKRHGLVRIGWWYMQSEPLNVLSDDWCDDWILNEYLNIPEFDGLLEPTESGCLVWMGATGSRGQGYLWDGKKTILAHRHAWRHFHGSLPRRLIRTCGNMRCCNIEHIVPESELEGATC